MMQFLKTPRKQLLGEYLSRKVRLRISNFSFKLVEVFLRVVNRFQRRVSLSSVFNLNNKNVNALIARDLSGLPVLEIFNTAGGFAECGIEISCLLLVNSYR